MLVMAVDGDFVSLAMSSAGRRRFVCCTAVSGGIRFTAIDQRGRGRGRRGRGRRQRRRGRRRQRDRVGCRRGGDDRNGFTADGAPVTIAAVAVAATVVDGRVCGRDGRRASVRRGGRRRSSRRRRRRSVSSSQLLVVMVMVNVMVMARGRAGGDGGGVGPSGRTGDGRIIVRGGHVEQRLGIANKFVNVPFAWQTIIKIDANRHEITNKHKHGCTHKRPRAALYDTLSTCTQTLNIARALPYTPGRVCNNIMFVQTHSRIYVRARRVIGRTHAAGARRSLAIHIGIHYSY